MGLSLARSVTSPAVAFLVAGLAAADLFSVAAGPKRALVEGMESGEPTPLGSLLSYLLLIFPTFGNGFALVAAAARLNLRGELPTLALGCAAVLLAMLTGLLLEKALPALPSIATAFLLATAAPAYIHFAGKNTP